jgi:hypothetical protein
MMIARTPNLVAIAFIGGLFAATAQAQTVETPIGGLDFEHGVPTKQTVTKLYDAMDFQRASQLFIWGLPLVEFGNLQAILEGTAGALPDDLALYLGNEQSVFLTPNAITPYIVGYLDLAKTGPVEMEIPAGAIAGSVMDFWQRPLSDLGVAGPDHGKGQIYFRRAGAGDTGDGGGRLGLAVADAWRGFILSDARPRRGERRGVGAPHSRLSVGRA